MVSGKPQVAGPEEHRKVGVVPDSTTDVGLRVVSLGSYGLEEVAQRLSRILLISFGLSGSTVPGNPGTVDGNKGDSH